MILSILQDYFWFISFLVLLTAWGRLQKEKQSLFEVLTQLVKWLIEAVFGEKYTRKEGIFISVISAATLGVATFIFLITFPILRTEIAEKLDHWHLTEHKEHIYLASYVISAAILILLMLGERVATEMFLAKHTGGRTIRVFRQKLPFTSERLASLLVLLSTAAALMWLVSTANGKREVKQDITLQEVKHIDLGTDSEGHILTEKLKGHQIAAAEYLAMRKNAEAKKNEWAKKAGRMKDPAHAWQISAEAKREEKAAAKSWEKEKAAIAQTQTKIIARARFIEKENKGFADSFDTAVAAKKMYGQITGIGLDVAYLLLNLLSYLAGGGNLQPVEFEKEKPRATKTKKVATGTARKSNRLGNRTPTLLNRARESLGNFLNTSGNREQPEKELKQPVVEQEQPKTEEKATEETEEQPKKKPVGATQPPNRSRPVADLRKSVYNQFAGSADGVYAKYLEMFCQHIDGEIPGSMNAFCEAIGDKIGKPTSTVKSFYIQQVRPYYKG